MVSWSVWFGERSHALGVEAPQRDPRRFRDHLTDLRRRGKCSPGFRDAAKHGDEDLRFLETYDLPTTRTFAWILKVLTFP